MFSPRKLFILISFVTAISLYIALPQEFSLNLNQGPFNLNQTITKNPINLQLAGLEISPDLNLKLGLDLQGGTHLLLEANMDNIAEADRTDALESAKEIITRRVDLFGVAEPLVQTSVKKDSYQIIVELPGTDNIEEAIDLIGQTARLDFREQDETLLDDIATPSAISLLGSFTSTGLTGKDLKRSSIQFDPNTSEPTVSLEFTDEGATMFADITERNIGKPVGIFLDEIPITLPRVNDTITTGQAVISGQFTPEEAKNLSIQLNAGALPVPIKIIEQRNVGATLGETSIQKSLQAGLVGLTMVVVFMIASYGYLGFLSTLALSIYALITLAIYKLFSVTITLPGLAGFLLSVGMAVDSNILIFERLKEELRAGKQAKIAMELGFGRAWDSIKDANIATLTICFILFNPFNWNFLNTSGVVRGFALTLSLGIFISLFTGIVVTRTLIRLFYKVNNS